MITKHRKELPYKTAALFLKWEGTRMKLGRAQAGQLFPALALGEG
jgi:hypothetical protein